MDTRAQPGLVTQSNNAARPTDNGHVYMDIGAAHMLSRFCGSRAIDVQLDHLRTDGLGALQAEALIKYTVHL
jgi:hypothetical protein